MSVEEKSDSSSIDIKPYAAILMAVWTLLVAGSMIWNAYQGEREVYSMARIQARVVHQRDVIYRRWNADHGGVYVPARGKTIPNPYIDLPNRDIPGPSGIPLTLMNPAYMTRQIHELAKEAYGVHGHITSLKPIRPENAADPWETRALRTFESGAAEVSSVEEIEGESYMRLMRPLVTEEDCLACHSDQGYSIGDVRGGLSVAIPMAPLWRIERARIVGISIAHGLVWLAGLLGIVAGTRRLEHQEGARAKAAEALREANRKLIESEGLKEDLTNMIVHDMKNPVNNTMMALDLIGLEFGDEARERQGESRDDCLDLAKRNQFKLSEMITNLLEICKFDGEGVEIRKEKLDLLDLVNRTVERHSVEMREESKKINVSVHPEARWIESDRRLIERILSNLISNSIKHSYENGGISVRVDRGPEEQWITLSVRDSGEGIPTEDHEKIFEKFGQSELRELGRRSDTGLGLAFCKMAVEALGGRIWVESEVEEGSCFTFTLPGEIGRKPSVDIANDASG